MKTAKKLTALVLVLMLMIGAIAVMTVLTGADDAPPSLRIAYCNLSYSDTIYIKYAVKADNAENVKLLIWLSPQEEYTLGSEDAVLAPRITETINGDEHIIFDYKNLMARQMTDVVYARAYTEEDGEIYYSKVNKYSILQYAYNKLGKTGTATKSEKLQKLLNMMLNYGAAAQEYFNYKVDRLATMDYYQIVLTDGTLDDGCKHGLYLPGEQVRLNAPATNENGDFFAYWSDADGKKVALNKNNEVTVGTQNMVYTPMYVSGENALEFISNGDGTCYVKSIGTCTDTDVVIPAVSPYGEIVTSIADTAFLNCSDIKSITIPAEITSIGDSAFAGCSGLTDVYFDYAVDDWDTLPIGENNMPLLESEAHFKDTGAEDGNGLFADRVDSIGMANVMARAKLWMNIEFTAKGTLYADNEDRDVISEGERVRGLWYSSTRGTDQFIGYAVSLESLMTALNNPQSVLYNRTNPNYFAADSTGNADGASNVYGTNCSQYVSWTLGLPYLTVTEWMPRLECFVNENGVHDTSYGGVCWDSAAGAIDLDALRTELKLCDVMNSNHNYGGNAGHSVIITGIRRDANGLIQEMDISDDWWASTTRVDGVKTFNCIRTKTYTWDEFVSKFIESQGYRVYRYADLTTVSEVPDLDQITYSDLCTSRGDKVAIRPNQDISLNVVANADQYAGIVLLKNGVYHSHQAGTATWKLIDPNNASYPLTSAKYTAILYKSGDNPKTMTPEDANETNSTSFIVCAVTVSRSTATVPHTYSYTAEAVDGVYPTPMQVTIKDAKGYTKYVHVLNDTDFNGSGAAKVPYYGGNYSSFVHVPFQTEYGFVIAEIKFDNQPLAKPTLPEDAATVAE